MRSGLNAGIPAPYNTKGVRLKEQPCTNQQMPRCAKLPPFPEGRHLRPARYPKATTGKSRHSTRTPSPHRTVHHPPNYGTGVGIRRLSSHVTSTEYQKSRRETAVTPQSRLHSSATAAAAAAATAPVSHSCSSAWMAWQVPRSSFVASVLLVAKHKLTT